jgi:hypothetical protein
VRKKGFAGREIGPLTPCALIGRGGRSIYPLFRLPVLLLGVLESLATAIRHAFPSPPAFLAIWKNSSACSRNSFGDITQTPFAPLSG